MHKAELLKLIAQGEGQTVEFKKSTEDITKDVYDTVCSFSNRDGGHILLGVRDDGEVVGVSPAVVSKIKKDFVTAINNAQKFYPPLYLQLEECIIEDKIVLYLYVPVSSQVCRHHSRIFDRSNDSDIDITDNTDLVYQLYARKSGSYFVNKVTRFGLEDLRSDLIDRARAMTSIRSANHPWKVMSDEELLRSAGLILKDEAMQIEGVTIAGILLFGKDATIMSVLPQHKTDAIFRVENLDRYDDRDVIITNLLDTYDRLIAFGHKHLSDPFVLEGVNSVSARDKILREIVSNSLAHRDYSSGYVAKFVIERDKLFTENANRSHGFGALNLSSFEPYAKNPPISKVFREISLADELGSGMRNTYKYTKLYSGGEPEFIEGDVFRTIIPLNDVATGVVGPSGIQAFGEEKTGLELEKQAFDNEKKGLELEKQAFERFISILEFTKPTKANMLKMYNNFGYNTIFSRADVMRVTGLSASPATELLNKLKTFQLVESVPDAGRGKYRFVHLNYEI